MNYLIAHPSAEVQKQEVLRILQEQFPEHSPEQLLAHQAGDVWQLDISDKNTLGVDEVKHLLTHLRFKPAHLSMMVGIIWRADKLTIPAQNALLKDLEDSSEKWLFILATPQITAVLPTIRSRCQIRIPQKVNQRETLREIPEQGQALVKHLLDRNDRVGAFQTIQQTVEKLSLDDLAQVLRSVVMQLQAGSGSSVPYYADNLLLVQEAHQALLHNANKRLTLEDLWLRLKSQ